jgi:peptide/nickel transport system permease protein
LEGVLLLKSIRSIRNWSFQLKAGVFFLLLSLIVGFVLPLFGEPNPQAWNTYFKNLKPSHEHLLGTTSLGQDIFWLLTHSIRNSFIIGIIVAFFATIIGVLLGSIAGFRGGIIDRIITLLMDTFIVIPSLPILILLGSLLKGRASVFSISLILIIFNWPWPARQVRAMTLSLRERDFIDTARFSGEKQGKIIIKEFLPHIASWSMACFINTILVAIRTESSLAVIGMSNNAQATLGTMIYWANQHQALLLGNWYWIGAPLVAISVIFISLFMTLSGAQNYSSLKRGK